VKIRKEKEKHVSSIGVFTEVLVALLNKQKLVDQDHT
jgi:hypothetical protein